MKITVISDTHLPRRKSHLLPDIVVQSIEQTDALIHAGDYMLPEVVEYLKALTSRFEGVAGNNDGFEIFHELGQKKIIELSGYKIGIVHGDGYGNTLQIAKHTFKDDQVDIVIFGHSHQAYKEWDNGVLYFNPGSPTDKRRSPQFSYGEITLGDEIDADIYFFS